jgi:hypothetical protein
LSFFAHSAAYKTVCNYLKGHRYYLKINGFSLALWDAWVLHPRILRGIQRVKGDATNPKQAITPETLLAIYKVLPAGHLFLSVWVAMLVGFYASLRKFHLCVESVSLTWHAALLLRKHIEFFSCQILCLSHGHLFQDRSVSTAHTCHCDSGPSGAFVRPILLGAEVF